MSRTQLSPVVGIAANLIRRAEHPLLLHGTSESYIGAVSGGGGAIPLLIPALGDDHDFAALADRLDGLFLTGGRANIEPHHYGGPPFPDDEYRDPARDATVLPLIRACIDRGVPVFGVCRGMQEINVALGGSLHYRVHLVDGMMDHRMPTEGDMDTKFGLRHSATLAPGGLLSQLVGETDVMINSAHGQGVERLAPGLEVEALAPDGLVEAFRLRDSDSFVVGVQWHAEWRFGEHKIAGALFRTFGAAARDRAATHARRDATA